MQAELREPAFGADGAEAERLVASLIALSPYRRGAPPPLRRRHPARLAQLHAGTAAPRRGEGGG